jgi:hypothetical protein
VGTVLVVLLVVLLVVAAAWIVTGPLLRAGEADDASASRRAALEAAKEAKYREIRDAELDFRTGKLSDEDYAAIDRTLRAEAVEILRELDELA